MQKRIKRHDLQEEDPISWLEDPGEKATRIWYWWRCIISETSHNLPAFTLAIRLVVLTQLSSCAVECVFSRIKEIREACKDALYEDMLEIRVLQLCNGDLSSLTE